MTNVGSVTLELHLDRSPFDREIENISRSKLPDLSIGLQLDSSGAIASLQSLRDDLKSFDASIKLNADTAGFKRQIEALGEATVKVKLNIKDFERQIKGLHGFLPAVLLPIELDASKVRSSFAEIGKHAAAGFKQGFAAIEDTAKSPIDSMVRSVNKQLGIQSPSKVFRQIGKYAIAGLIQGLESLDESKLKGIVNKVESYFKNSKAKINLDVDSGNFNPIKTFSGAEITKEITSAIEEGFKKSRPKSPSTFSKIFSGIGDTLLAPLKGIATGAFEGVGLQLSKQIATGLGRGIESQLAPIIGSFELLGEKLVTSAIPRLGNTVGGKIAVSILKSPTIQRLKQDLAGQITSIIGESEQLIASQAGAQKNKQNQQQQQKLAQKEIGIQLQQSIATAPQRQQQAQQIKQELLPQYQQEVKSRQSQLTGLQADKYLLVAAGTETEEIKQAIDEIDLQIAEVSNALAEAKKGEQFLQNQIAAFLNETKSVVDKLKTAGADTSGVENIDFALKESTNKGQELITRLDGNIQIQQANIKEARSRVKLYKKQEAQFKQDAIAALGNGDNATAKQLLIESKKSGLRANAAQSEVTAYKSNISEILKIKDEALKGFVEERKKLREELNTETQRLADNLVATDVVAEAPAVKRIKPKRKVLTKATSADIKPIQASNTTAKKQIPELSELPQVFKDVVSQVASLTQIKLAPGQIPTLVRGSENAQFSGKYNSVDNAITLPAKSYDELVKGAISPDVIKTLVHELRHAMQTGFGSRQLTQSANPEFELVKGTSEEQQKLGSRIQASTEFFKKGALNATPQDVETVKKLEEDAYVFAERYFEQVFHSIQQNLQSGIKPGSIPTETDLLKQVQAAQTTITANLKQSFKGKLRDRKVTNSELAGSTLTDIDQQIAYLSEQLKRTDLSGETRQKLGQFKGSLERRYRVYSPALRAKQPGSSSLGLSSSQGQSDTQAQGVELFEVSDEALKDFERQARTAERRAKRVLKNIFKNSNRAAKRADKALAQLEQETSQQVADTETGVAYNEATASKNTRRRLRKIQRGYGGDIDAPTIETDAPRVEKDAPKPPKQSFFKGLAKEFRLTRLGALSKQAEYLGQQAQILLADIDAQIALGKTQEKEATIIQKQIQQNERRLNAVLNQIKRASSGADPKLTPGDIERLSSQAQTLTDKIDTDKQRLADVQSNIKNGKELETVAKNLRAGIAGASEASKQQNIKELERQNALIRENLELLGEPPPPRNPFEVILGGADKFSKMIPNLFTLLKGLFAFQASNLLRGFFTNLAIDAFKAHVELDRLKTALNFASGGSAGGAQSLAFVRKQVEDLGVPLKASTEGFVQLAAAAKGSALEGQQTRELFTGISQASAVLSLSADQSQGAILALSQMISKGKVSAEELRQQLGERLPGALGIAARALGVTETEFSRLLDNGQIISQDFLPKFAKQLQAEFGDAAKDASNNAQSAIFKLENSFLSLQQGIGEGVAPAAITGLTTFSTILKGLAKVAKELGLILLAVTTTLSVKMVIALQAVIAQLIATKMATGTLGGGFASLANTINNSFSAKLTVGIFAVLEIINLLNQAVNTELVGSFNNAAKAAQRAAEASAKAFNKPSGNNKSTATEPESSSGVGRFLDNTLIKAANLHAENSSFGLIKKPFTSYGELEQSNVNRSVEDISLSNADYLSNAKLRLGQLKSSTGDIGQLPGIDAKLRSSEQERQVLQADIARNYTNKGLAVPAEYKQRLEASNLNINDLNNRRSEVAKPFTLDLARADQQINSIKAQIEALKSPEAIAAVGGDEAASKLTDQLKESLKSLKAFKAEAESALASLRVDPILAFNSALRQLNLTFAKSQEDNQQTFERRKTENSQELLRGFGTNKLATKQASVNSAIAERDKASSDLQALESAVKDGQSAIAASEFQSTMRRLGVNEGSSVAQIDDLLKNTSDDADKGILEKLKAERERRNQLNGARGSVYDSELKVKQATQDISLAELTDSANKQELALQRAEAKKLNSVKMAQQMRVLSESDAALKIARIQLNSTTQQERNIASQLAAWREYHAQGKIGAEELANKEKELNSRSIELEKQSADQRLAIFEATNRRKLEQIELVNKKAEAVIALSQTTNTTSVKQDILTGALSPQQAAQEQNQVDQNATRARIEFIKTEILQTKQLHSQKVISAKESTEKQLSLNQELAQANQQLIDQQIQFQEQLRAEIEKTFSRRKQQLDLENSRRDTQIQADSLEVFKSSPVLDTRGFELETTGKSLQNRSSYLQQELDLLQEQLSKADELYKSEQERTDKKRELFTEIDRIRKEQISTEKQLIQNQQEQEINGIERLRSAQENRFKLAISNIDTEKAKLDLYNQSLDRTAKLEESRYNLRKALGDAGTSDLEIRRDGANRALELSRKLKDENLDPRVRSEVNNQLGSLGFGNSEMSILEKRSQIEDEIAAKKLEALKQEQAYQQQALQLDLKRQQIAAQTGIYEAESARLAASKSKLEAESALRVATIKKDPAEMEAAKIGIELASREIALADKRFDSAQQNLAIQDELAKNATLAQQATQRAAISQQTAADGARKQASALEKVEASVKKVDANLTNKNRPALLEKDEAAPNSVPPGWENPYLQKTGEGIFEHALRINTMKMTGQIVETHSTRSVVDQNNFHYDEALNRRQGNPPASDFEGKSFDTSRNFEKLLTATNEIPENLRKLIPSINSLDKSLQPGKNTAQNALTNKPTDIAAQAKNAIAPTTTAIDNTNITKMIIDGFKGAVSGVTQRLDRLSESIITLAKMPRSLTVSTPNPVNDAAKIMNNMTQQKTKAAKL